MSLRNYYYICWHCKFRRMQRVQNHPVLFTAFCFSNLLMNMILIHLSVLKASSEAMEDKHSFPFPFASSKVFPGNLFIASFLIFSFRPPDWTPSTILILLPKRNWYSQFVICLAHARLPLLAALQDYRSHISSSLLVLSGRVFGVCSTSERLRCFFSYMIHICGQAFYICHQSV